MDGLEETEQLALRLPLEGQAGVFHQPVRGELGRLPAIEDRRDNVGCEEREPDEARNVGTYDPFLSGDLFQGEAGVLKQARADRMSPDEKTYQGAIDSRRRGSIVYHHSHLDPGALQTR